eukprot:981941_1
MSYNQGGYTGRQLQRKDDNNNYHCYHCFQIQSGISLRCSGCQSAHYCNKSCQRAHWKYHKSSCKWHSQSEIKDIENMKASECIQILQSEHRSSQFDLSALCLKRILKILSNWDQLNQDIADVSDGDIGMELHTITRIFSLPHDSSVEYYHMLWAVPGMVEILLNTSLERKQRSDLLYDSVNGIYGDVIPGYQFSFYVVNILCRTITNQSSLGGNCASCWDCYDADLVFNNMFTAISNRLLSLYGNVHLTANDCGDAFAPIPNVVQKLLTLPIYKRLSLKIDINDFIINTSLIDACLNDMFEASNKRGATNVFEAIVEHLDYDLIWKTNGKRFGSYLILLLNHWMEQMQHNDDDYLNLQNKQTKLLNKCMNIVLFGRNYKEMYKKCNVKRKNKLLQSYSKAILLYHCQRKTRSQRYAMSLYHLQPHSYSFSHSSFDFIIWYFFHFYYFSYVQENMDTTNKGRLKYCGLQLLHSLFDKFVSDPSNKYQLIRIWNCSFTKKNFDIRLRHKYSIAQKKDETELQRECEDIVYHKLCDNVLCKKTNLKICFTTGSPLKVCGRCRRTYYCSRKCQKIHWLFHRASCYPFS